jgi:hypothetical protein
MVDEEKPGVQTGGTVGGEELEMNQEAYDEMMLPLQDFYQSEWERIDQTGNGNDLPTLPTTEVLPSLPNISSVGTIAPTGFISWNAIPGGFQPLPQTAGGRKKLYQLSQFHGGINQKSSPRDISDQECQGAVGLTVSQVGRIKLLGDIKNTDNSITTHATNTDVRGGAGYGLFQFTGPAALDNTLGEYVITIVPDGSNLDATDSTGTTSAFIYYGDATYDNDNVSHVVYVAGNGLYANDANLLQPHSRKSMIFVSRGDIHGTVDINAWVNGTGPLISSPTYHASNTSTVALQATHADAGAAGVLVVTADPDSTGTWSGTYEFYASWLFDGGVETGLSNIGEIAFSDNKCNFNVSIQHSAANPLGGNQRIEGARIYFKEQGAAERFLLGELSLIDGVKGALDSTFTPWNASGTNVYDMGSDADTPVPIIFENPPEIYTYVALNGYYANEVYSQAPDTPAVDSASIPTAKDVRYRTAVVGSGGIVFIGNVMFDGKHMPDSMMFSMPGKPGLFPQYNRFDSPASDGSPITALASFGDTILQFRHNSMYVINVSNPGQFYSQASFRDCGVFNPCQVFTTAFGVIFANKNGCFIFDGKKVISLTSGKFDIADWDLENRALNGSAIANNSSSVPCVGYDPRSQNIIVLKDINHEATSVSSGIGDEAWVYNIITQSWTEGVEMIVNIDGNRHTNFIITSKGYLSILRGGDATGAADLVLYNYNHIATATQTIYYKTKDLDFGLPSQTKKIFKVYLTYEGDGSAVLVRYHLNGINTDYNFNSTDTPLAVIPAGQETAIELVPSTASQATGIRSFVLEFAGTGGIDFQINDISILYRVRPIK